jgi:hypothetical protein
MNALASILGVSLLWAVTARAQTAPPLQFGWVLSGDTYRLTLEPNTAFYFGVQDATNIHGPWSPPLALGLGLGGFTVTYTRPADDIETYVRLFGINVFAPRDSDQDGIDDLYELEHLDQLDPLDPSDAAKDPDGDGFTHLDDYRRLRGLGLAGRFVDPITISREMSIFNFGSPTARIEAVSSELSVYNAFLGSGPSQTDLAINVSREVSLFNFGSPPGGRFEAIGREVSVFNFGSPSARIEALAHEVTVYNANLGSMPPATDLAISITRELTVFNLGQPTARIETISREVTLLNFQEPQ